MRGDETQGNETASPSSDAPAAATLGWVIQQIQALSNWQRGVLIAVAGALVLALVAAVVVVADTARSTEDGGSVAARNMEPFREAVTDLAEAPVLRYEDTSLHGITENQVTVTAGGSKLGTTSSGNAEHDRDILHIDGTTFGRWQVDPAPPDDADDGKKAPSEWAVGGSLDGSVLDDELLDRTPPPAELADVLAQALDAVENAPASDGAGPGDAASAGAQKPRFEVNGTPALGVDTPAGRLMVTAERPYRVLRLEPYDLAEGLDEAIEQLEDGGALEALPDVTAGPLAAGNSEGMDLTPITGELARAVFDDLVKQVKRLKNATDGGINFTLDGAGEMTCGNSGCTAVQNFNGTVSSKAKGRVTDGEVTAVMSATFSIDGQPAGNCTSEARTFPLQGTSVSGTLKCTSPAAGPVFAVVDRKYAAQAQAEANACGCKVTRTFPSNANTLIDARALAAVEATALLDKAKAERDSFTQGADTPGKACSASKAADTADTVPVFRVESPGNARLNIDGGGNVSTLGDNMLFLNFGDEARAHAFRAQRLDQGFEGTVIKRFDVPRSYYDDLVSRSVPESQARGNSVINVDTTKTSSSFGLRSSEFPRLRRAIVPGSGRTC